MKRINLPAMAFDENLVFRPATMEDISIALALFNICSFEQVGVEEFEENELLTEWCEPGFHLETDSRIVINQVGQAVGYIEVWDTSPHVRIYAWGQVHPDYRDTGLGTRLAWWSETRARQSLPKAPQAARVALSHWSYGTDATAKDLFLSRGFELNRHSLRMEIQMNGSPPKPEWPLSLDGKNPIQIRPILPGEEIRVVEALIDTFKDHWGYVEKPFEEEKERWLHRIESDEYYDPSLWFLAMDGDEIAGISLNQRQALGHSDMGWVETLGVRRPWRRRGLGLALLQHTFRAYYQQGKYKVGLGVDAESLTGATRLYEKAGMKIVRQMNTYEKELRAGKDLSTQAVE